MTAFTDAVALVRAARTPEELFGAAEPARTYRRLARLLHPDAAPADRTSTATAAFARLAELWAEHNGRTAHHGGSGHTLVSPRHHYAIGERIATGDVADLYLVSHERSQGLLKLPRRPGDSDLMAAEATALTTLAERGDPRHRAYAPTLVESFRHEDLATGARRTLNVLDHQAGFVPLTRVAAAYPDGVDPRDVAWMWRRLLVAIGYAHRAGVVHGAVLPDHVMIHPERHGLVLVDWCYAVAPGESIPALVGRYRDWYPPEVPSRGPATGATDIYLATRCMRWLMGGRAHPALDRFARGCTLAAPRMRPQDAWKLLAELDELLENLYGPRRFRPFVLPHAAGDPSGA